MAGQETSQQRGWRAEATCLPVVWVIAALASSLATTQPSPVWGMSAFTVLGTDEQRVRDETEVEHDKYSGVVTIFTPVARAGRSPEDHDVEYDYYRRCQREKVQPSKDTTAFLYDLDSPGSLCYLTSKAYSLTALFDETMASIQLVMRTTFTEPPHIHGAYILGNRQQRTLIPMGEKLDRCGTFGCQYDVTVGLILTWAELIQATLDGLQVKLVGRDGSAEYTVPAAFVKAFAVVLLDNQFPKEKLLFEQGTLPGP